MSADFDIRNGKLIKYEGAEAEIVIPDGVVEIGEDAFREKKRIVSVKMPDTVVKIGSHAFYKCSKLKSVTFSKNLEEIDYEGFEGCSALKTVELPETLRSLGTWAFADCTGLTSVKCESKVFEMGGDPFSGHSSTCSKLADKDGFLIFCGVLYAYYGTSKEIVIPDGVRYIAAGAFESGSYSRERKLDLTSVAIPASVEEIGNFAFKNNRHLKNMKMPDGIRIDRGAFAGCGSLADENGLFIRNGVAYAYYGLGDTVRVPAGTRVLTAGLFANVYECNPGNKNIHTVILPDGLEEIGAGAFMDLDLLERITIPDSVKSIGAGAFAGCGHLLQVDMPKAVEHMGEGTFAGCPGLADENGFVVQDGVIHSWYGNERDIVIPEGITAIASGVFNGKGITSVVLPSTLKKLGSAFSGCDMLTEIEIPEGVEELCDRTFFGCSRLEKVSLPGSLVRIGDSAFEGCERLKDVNIPNSVKMIGKCAFSLCASLGEVNIPDGVEIVSWRAFLGCKSLHKLCLPESVRVIDGQAFEDCANLQEVTIPDAVETIEYSAFENCTSLKTVNYRKMRAEVSESAFDGCTGLVDENGLTIIADTLWACKSGMEHVTVPEGIVRIAPDVFREGAKGCGRGYHWYKAEGTLKSVVLPSTLTEIGDGAFAGCEALKRVTIPNGVRVIGEEGFESCRRLTEIELPDSVVNVGKRAFNGCRALKKAKLSSSLTALPPELFRGCRALKSIVIHGTVGSIGADAFLDCGSLGAIEVGEGNAAYSSRDGILYNKSGDTLLCAPGGQKLKEFAIPEGVKTIGPHAFIDCLALEKIVIPAWVENIGDEVFPRHGWNSKPKLTDIEVSPAAGSGTVGENVFDFKAGDNPLVYPKLPPALVKEQATQICLGLGFCQNPEKYEGEYAGLYRGYAASHKKTLLNKARQLKLKKAEQYFAGDAGRNAPAGGYAPDLSLKKPNELQKVEILEEAVIKGTLDDLKAVLETYKTFELTARALGLAARYRGIDHVRVLVEHEATFRYEIDPKLQKKYSICQGTAAGIYRTQYYLMLVPSKLDLKPHSKWNEYYEYDYTPMYGVSHMNIADELEKNVLPLQDRIEITKYISGVDKLGVSLDEMLFWALTRYELDFADALMEMGVDLQKTPPSYYIRWGEVPTYMETITSANRSLYWQSYVTELAKLKDSQLLPVLERFHALASAAGKKLVLSQQLFDGIKWNDASLAFAFEHIDLSRVNQKKALEAAVSDGKIAFLVIMADAGWLAQRAKRENLIAYARENKCLEALAWLMDYKNRTVDAAAEEAREEAKALRELSADPNSVSALRKIWSYKKQEDGTLVITSYKGSDTEVVIPAMIGKSKVSAIGEDAFAAHSWGKKAVNHETRKKITSITIPEGVTAIEKYAFACESLKTIHLPSTLRKIGKSAFSGCNDLSSISIPTGIRSIAPDAFWCCWSLKDKNGFIVIDGILLGYDGQDTSLRIPDGVRSVITLKSAYGSEIEKSVREIILPEGLETIGESAFENYKGLEAITIPASVKTIENKAFYKSGIKTVELREGLEIIGEGAFALTPLETVRIPGSVKAIGAQAFYGCGRMRDLFISDKTKKLYKEVLGKYDDDDSSSWGKPSGIYVHTPAGSAAEKYMKRYSGVHVVND